jgi:hypothetical protein
MSLFLVQVGKSTWVDPDAIQAVEWSGFGQCPKLFLSGGNCVLASNFKDMASAAVANNAEAGTNALLAWLRQADIKRNTLNQ